MLLSSVGKLIIGIRQVCMTHVPWHGEQACSPMHVFAATALPAAKLVFWQ
jgi:hypothetical protein